MDATWRAVLRIQSAAAHESDADYADDVLGAVTSVVACDGYCLFGVDPVSGLRAFMLSRHGTDGVAARLAYNETVERDANRYVDLAAAPLPVGVLGGSVRSPRLHEVLRPLGIGSEMRMSLRSDRTMWGGLTLFRASGSLPFTADDTSRAGRLHGALTASVRARPVRRRRTTGTREAGIVLLDRHNVVLSVSPGARAWLAELCAGGTDEMTVDDIMRVVYDAANAARASHPAPAPLCRIRTSGGRWLVVNGSVVDAAPADVAVVLQPATVEQLLPAVGAWLGLTSRERDVLGLVVAGMAAKHIAGELRLSVLTVNTHLRAIYRKAGAAGREELMGQLR